MMQRPDPGGDISRIPIFGLKNQSYFRKTVFAETARIDPAKVQAEVLRRSEHMVRADNLIRSILLECSNLLPFTAAAHKAVGLPVYAFTNKISLACMALARRLFGSTPPSA
jgi:hypothetical protein